MSESLYKISSEYQSRLNEIDENTDMEAFTEWLNEATPELHNKILAVAAYTKELQSKQSAVSTLIEELKEREEKFDQRIDKLRDNILNAMTLNGIKKVEGVEFDVSVRKNKSRVIIDDDAITICPETEKYIRRETKISFSRDLIYRDLIEGKSVIGCHLEESRSLQIKS